MPEQKRRSLTDLLDGPETVWPFMPSAADVTRPGGPGGWPRGPTPDYPGRYAGVGREMIRARHAAQAIPTVEGAGRFNPAGWEAFLAQAPSSENIQDLRKPEDIAAEKAATPPGYYNNLPQEPKQPKGPENSSLGDLGSLLNYLDQQEAAGKGPSKRKR